MFKIIIPACALALAFHATPSHAGMETSDYKSYGGGTGTDNFTIRDTPFRGAVTLRGGYDDNIFSASTDEEESYFTSIYGELNADLGSPRTQFTIGISGGATYYESSDSWDYTATLKSEVTHRATSRLTLSARIYATYQVEPDFSILIGSERRNGQYFFGNSQFSAKYQWSPRFSTVSSYSLVGVFYEDDVSADASDRFEHYLSQEFRYLVRATTTLVAEYRFAVYDYTDNNINDGISNYFLVGVDQSFSPRLSASIRGGVEVRDNDAQGTQTAPYGEATLAYSYGRFSNISWVNRYGFEQSGSIQGTERRTFRSGLRIKQGFTARLSAVLGLFYHNSQYDAPNFDYSENLYDASAGLQFDVTRNVSLNAGYSYTRLESDLALGDYDRNRVNIGATFSF